MAKDKGPQKFCRRCKKIRPVTKFYKDSSRKDGRNSTCSDCMREYMRGYSETYKAPLRDSSIELSGSERKKNGTDISALLQVSRVDEKITENIIEARMIFKAFMYAYSAGKPLSDVLVELKIDKSVQAVRYLINELKEAARQSMTLEEYIRKGRPFKIKTRAKVLIAKK